jgi:hypothetical protein
MDGFFASFEPSNTCQNIMVLLEEGVLENEAILYFFRMRI